MAVHEASAWLSTASNLEPTEARAVVNQDGPDSDAASSFEVAFSPGRCDSGSREGVSRFSSEEVAQGPDEAERVLGAQ